MNPILSITNIPIDIDINITHGSFERNEETPNVDISNNNGNYDIKANPASINIDKLKAQAVKPRTDQFEQNVNQTSDVLTFSYQGIMSISNTENANTDPNSQQQQQETNPASIQNIQRASKSIENIASLIPQSSDSSIYYDNGKLGINYNTDKMLKDFKLTGNHNYKFTPGKIELIINELPSVKIEYEGDPIYFPRSADPNYEEPAESNT